MIIFPVQQVIKISGMETRDSFFWVSLYIPQNSYCGLGHITQISRFRINLKAVVFSFKSFAEIF